MIMYERKGYELKKEGISYEMEEIEEVVIGGKRMYGGIGRIKGKIIGEIIIGVMKKGIDMMGIK